MRTSILLLLVACGPAGETDPPDADGDGFTSEVDCDDGDASVRPGAEEVCNEVDDDCDGEVDEEAIDRRSFYVDADGDGWGRDSSVTIACFLPDGHVERAGDCADDDPDRSPDVEETCNELDDDCDGDIDDDPVDGDAWYPDLDRDGYGGDEGRVLSCVPLFRHLPSGGDCDDSDATVNPRGTEICDGAGVDEDCDGLVDDADDSLEQAPPWFIDGDGDGYGDVDTPIFQCAPPADRIPTGGDCRDDLPAVNPGADEICANGLDDDCDEHGAACGVVGALDVSLSDGSYEGRQSESELGDGVFGLEDRTGDGRGELGLVASRWDASSSVGNAGQLALVDGPAPGGSIDTADHAWLGATDNGRLGIAVAAAGDIDDDGEPELWVSSAVNGVYLIDIDETLEEAPLRIEQRYRLDKSLGQALAPLSDVTGDGTDDVLIGLPLWISGDTLGGAMVMEGHLRGVRDADDAHARIWGVDSGGRCGRAVDGLDTDGDGVSGVAIGCPEVDLQRGELVVFTDSPVGEVTIEDADLRLRDTGAYRGAGERLAHGDLDGDGYEDLVVGAPGSGSGSASWAGAVYVLQGPVRTGASLSSPARRWEGEASRDGLGDALATGDVDGDGDDEVLVGAPRADGSSGTVYLFDWDDGARGAITGADATARIAGDEAGARLGWSVAIVPDLDADGYDDAVIGAPRAFVVADGVGKVWLFRGGPGL